MNQSDEMEGKIGKGEGRQRKSHEGPEENRDIALLFL